MIDNIDVTDYQFCQFCELCKTCKKVGLPKILSINRMVMNFIFNFENGIKIYPNEGSYLDQPVWFNTLFDYGRSILNKLKIEDMENEIPNN